MMAAGTVTRKPRQARDAPRRRRGRRILVYLLGGGVAVLATIWLGARFVPDPLPHPALEVGAVDTVPVPGGLPAPVARFYDALYGDQVPVVDSAVISGRGNMRIAGMTFPARFRFAHVTGQSYRHYIELTVFGRRLLTVDEHLLDGRGRLELPFGVSEGPNVDQGANLALWAEAVWMPSVWVTDPAVSWQPIDETSARLTVPFGDEVETFTVGFDPATGLLDRMESMRFKGDTDHDKVLWINEVPEWDVLDGHPVPLRATITWADEGSPWADLRTEHVLYNADLHDYIEQNGP